MPTFYPVNRWLGVVLGVAFVALAAPARAATPLPERDPARSVYDVAGIIEDGTEAVMEARHTELFQKTGVAMVTVTVPRLVDEVIEDFAVRILNSWGVGNKGEDRGVVTAVSLEPRKIWVSTGYGAEGFLNDAKVARLIDDHALALLKQNDFTHGIDALDRALAWEAAREYRVALSGDAPPPPRARDRAPSGLGLIGLLIGAAVFIYLAIRHPALLALLLFSGRGGGGFGGGGFGGGGFGGGGGGFGGFGGGGGGGGGGGRSF